MDIEEYKKALKILDMILPDIINDNTIQVVGEPIDGFKPMIYRFKCPFCGKMITADNPDEIWNNAKEHFKKCMKRKYARKKIMEEYAEYIE